MMRGVAVWLGAGVLALFAGCAASESAGTSPGGGSGSGGSAGSTPDGSAGSGGSGGSLFPDGSLDASHNEDAQLDPDAACATATEKATLEHLPVDIIWMVDNSTSMQPAIDQVTQGLNQFAALIAQKSLDYKVIMLSLRSKTNPVTIGGSQRYAVCIPEPLAGDANCGNGPRFFQSSIDIRSTQPLEHFLGTLGQTTGYTPGTEKGGEPWKEQLRPNASRTIVVVTDDNARLSATEFEHFAGGKNPFNSLSLPPGILDPSWGGLFTDYVFSGIYGWGSDNDPSVKCTYPGGSQPPASGSTYSQLVQQTGGVRAQLCAGSSAWAPFFDSVAQSVVQGSKLSCKLALPVPSQGTLDPNKVNVRVVSPSGTTTLYKVTGAAACNQNGGWYYDDDSNPSEVLLCPSSCEAAQAAGSATGDVQIDVLFGCATIVS